MASSKKVASAYVDLQLQTAQFKAAIGEATGEMRKFSSQARQEMEKSRDSVRLLSEELGLGIPRGLQKIISRLPGVSTAMNLAFDGVVVFALIKTIADVTEKIVEFIKKANTAGTEFSSAMNKMVLSTNEENDKLSLSIEKMKAHLAEIEKKPATNGAAIALAEARVEADELAKSLGADLDAITKLFEEKGLGNISAFLTEQTGTDDAKKLVQRHVDAINAIDYAEQDRLSKLDPKDAAGRKKVQDEQQKERLKELKSAADDLTAAYNKLHEASVSDQKLQDKEGLGAIQGHDPHQSDSAMAIIGTAGHQFQAMYNQAVLHGQAADLAGQVDQAEADAKRKADAKEALAERQRKQEEAIKAFRDRYEAAAPAPPSTAEQEANPSALSTWKINAEQYKNNEGAAVQRYTDTPEFKARFTRLVDDLTPAIAKAVTEQANSKQADIDAEIERQQTAATVFNGQMAKDSQELGLRELEAINKLTEATDKSRESLTKSINEFNDAQDKVRLRSGQITESQYESGRVQVLGSSRDEAKHGNEIKANDDINKALYDWYAKKISVDMAVVEELNKEGLTPKNKPAFVYTPENGGESSVAADRADGLTPAQQARFTELLNYLGKYEAALENGFFASKDNIEQAHDTDDKTVDTNFSIGALQSKLAAYQSTAIGGVDAVFDEFEQRANDVGKQVHDLFTETLNDLNNTFIKMMTERDHRGVWKDMGKSIFTDTAKTGLQDAEGKFFKLLGVGTKVQHVFVENMPKDGFLGDGGSAPTSSLLGALNDSDWAGRLFGGRLFGPGGMFDRTASGAILDGSSGGPGQQNFFGTHAPGAPGWVGQVAALAKAGVSLGTGALMAGSGPTGALGPQTQSPDISGIGIDPESMSLLSVPGRASGGLMSPGDWYMTGEHGPELLQVGSTSKINNARDTAGIMGRSSGDTHIHLGGVDARGANDPAAVNAAVQRGIAAAAPHIIAASHAASKDQRARRPGSRQ